MNINIAKEQCIFILELLNTRLIKCNKLSKEMMNDSSCKMDVYEKNIDDCKRIDNIIKEIEEQL